MPLSRTIPLATYFVEGWTTWTIGASSAALGPLVGDKVGQPASKGALSSTYVSLYGRRPEPGPNASGRSWLEYRYIGIVEQWLGMQLELPRLVSQGTAFPSAPFSQVGWQCDAGITSAA